MANDVTHILQLRGGKQQIKKMLAAIQNDELGIGSIDFNKIIPMPEALNIECGSRTGLGINLYLTAINPGMPDMGFEKESAKTVADLVRGISTVKFSSFRNIDAAMSADAIVKAQRYDSLTELLQLGKQAVENYQEHGALTWYDWSIKNWGTKWNAYNQMGSPDDAVLRFDTAWSSCLEIMAALSRQYPNVELGARWADENLGHNLGEMVLREGNVKSVYFPAEGSKEAYEFAAEVVGVSLAEYGLYYSESTGTYEYQEPEESFDSMQM